MGIGVLDVARGRARAMPREKSCDLLDFSEVPTSCQTNWVGCSTICGREPQAAGNPQAAKLGICETDRHTGLTILRMLYVESDEERCSGIFASRAYIKYEVKWNSQA